MLMLVTCLIAVVIAIISDSVHNIATISRESSLATETVASKVYNITESVSNIREKIHELNEAASRLVDVLQKIEQD